MNIKNSEPFFSIVIVNYNGGEFIEDAILSVLNQDKQLFELIVIDGNSSDNSIEIINKYIDNISYFVSEPDNGQSQAFNKGFSQARGQYFFWLNSDDLLLPNSLSYAFELIKKNDECKWFVANTIFTDLDYQIIKCSKAPDWSDWALKDGVIYVNGPTSIFHRSLFFMSGGFNESYHFSMDTDLWIRFYKLGFKFIRINKYLWCFRIHELSKTSGTHLGKRNLEIEKETRSICIENDYVFTKTARIKQMILKLITGSFILSKRDSIKFRGLKIQTIWDKF